MILVVWIDFCFLHANRCGSLAMEEMDNGWLRKARAYSG